MGSFGGFYKGDKKKPSKAELDKKAKKAMGSSASGFVLPKLIEKKKD